MAVLRVLMEVATEEEVVVAAVDTAGVKWSVNGNQDWQTGRKQCRTSINRGSWLEKCSEFGSSES